MSETNGSHDWREQMNQRLEALEKAHKELEDSFIVLMHTETRMSGLVREQSEYMANHAERLAQSEARLERIETGLAEATDKINFLIDREMRREGGAESHR